MYTHLDVTIGPAANDEARERHYGLLPNSEVSVRTEADITRVFVSGLAERDAPFIVDLHDSSVAVTATELVVAGTTYPGGPAVEVRLSRG